ncbi:MAG: hypothetical protein ACLFPX_02180 [Candidatus Omnitrophota bacterium]
MVRIITGAFLFFLLGAAGVWAHPPQRIVADFDTARNELNLKVTHSTSSPGYHFVKKVIITINGEKVKEENLSAQKSDVFEYSTRLYGVGQGDRIGIEAQCSRAGSKKASFTVE